MFSRIFPTAAAAAVASFTGVAAWCGYNEYKTQKGFEDMCSINASRELERAASYRKQAEQFDEQSSQAKFERHSAEIAEGYAKLWQLKKEEGPYGWKDDCPSNIQRKMLNEMSIRYWNDQKKQRSGSG